MRTKHYASQAGVSVLLANSKRVTPKGIFNDKNKGKIQVIVDKVERMKTKQCKGGRQYSPATRSPPPPPVVFLI